MKLTEEGMEVDNTSILTSRSNTMVLDITIEQVQEWMNGKLIQDAFPNLTAVEREFLISGMSEAEQKEFFE